MSHIGNQDSFRNIQRSWNKILGRENPSKVRDNNAGKCHLKKKDYFLESIGEILKQISRFDDINQTEIDNWIYCKKK